MDKDNKRYSSNNLGKTLLVCGSIVLESLIFNGCKAKIKYSPRQEPIKETQESEYEFTRYGILCKGGDSDIFQIEMVDVDGDGDKDMIIGRRSGQVVLYENKMPQINKIRSNFSKHLNAQD